MFLREKSLQLDSCEELPLEKVHSCSGQHANHRKVASQNVVFRSVSSEARDCPHMSEVKDAERAENEWESTELGPR